MTETKRDDINTRRDLASAMQTLSIPQAHCVQAAMIDQRAPEIQEWSAPVRMTLMEEFEELTKRGGSITITRQGSESFNTTGPLKELLAEVSQECMTLRESIASETFQSPGFDPGSSEYERRLDVWNTSRETNLRIIDGFLKHLKDGSWDTMFSARSEIDSVQKLAERKNQKTPALSQALSALSSCMRFANEEAIKQLQQNMYAPMAQKLSSLRKTVDTVSGVSDKEDHRRWSGLAKLDDIEAKARSGEKEAIRNTIERLLELASREQRDGTFDGQKALEAIVKPAAKAEVPTQPVEKPRAGTKWKLWNLFG